MAMRAESYKESLRVKTQWASEAETRPIQQHDFEAAQQAPQRKEMGEGQEILIRLLTQPSRSVGIQPRLGGAAFQEAIWVQLSAQAVNWGFGIGEGLQKHREVASKSSPQPHMFCS